MTIRDVTPLQGIRVLNLGGGWAGRVASLLLGEQGAEVIEIQRPERESQLVDALLGRGKTLVTIDLRDQQGREAAFDLASGADIVLDNLAPGRAERFGLALPSIRERNPGVTWVSMPGFASGSALSGIAAWEGTIAASTGIYTDIHGAGPIFGGQPIFTAVPMASAYGGVHAAIAATMGLLHRLNTGIGQRIEVPLADAALSAMALLAMEIEGQPRRYDLPPIEKAMTEVAFPILRELQDHLTEPQRQQVRDYLARFARPQFGNHRCADGRLIFINAVDHVHHARACLDTLGVLNELLAAGMTFRTPYEEGGDGNNLCSSSTLSPESAAKLRSVMASRFLTKPAHEWERLLRKAGVPASVVRTTTEWLDWPEARVGGIVGELPDAEFGATAQAGRFLSIEGSGSASPALAPRRDGVDIGWQQPRTSFPAPIGSAGKVLSGVRVLDLSNIIAGPAGARVLAEFGADVTRIDPPAPFAGPRMTMWFGVDVNQGKRALILDLKSAQGRAVLERLVRDTDVVLHNFLDRSAESLGISHQQLQAINPDIISCQVSAWGGPAGGPLKDDPAFDPVLQAATGITARYGTPQAPALHGLASCVDYITGFSAALGIAQALVARRLGRGGARVRTSLSMGAQLVQFPFVVARPGQPGAAEPSGQDAIGYGPHYRQYRARDGWGFFACRPGDLAQVASLLEATEPAEARLGEAFARMSIAEAAGRLSSIASASFVPIMRLDALREASLIDRVDQFDKGTMPFAMLRRAHPSGHTVSLPLPTWYRMESTHVDPLSPAPAPGSDSRAVLASAGFTDDEQAQLFGQGVVRDRWAVLKHYLPH